MLEETFKDKFEDAYKERRKEITIDVFTEGKWDFPDPQDLDRSEPLVPEYGSLSPFCLPSFC